MSKGLKDILSGLNKDIEQEKLLQYLNRHLPDDEQHALEKKMNEDDFLNDAIEGLEELENKDNLPLHIRQLNEGLRMQLKKRNRRNDKRRTSIQPWIYYSIVIILTLVILAWFVIKLLS